MPRRTRTATRKRQRSGFRRKKFYRRRRRDVQPYSIVRKLKSVCTFDLNSASGSIAAKVLKLNSGIDPMGDITGVQGLGWDQHTSLYRRYVVIAWAVKMEMVSTDNTHPIICGFTPTTDASSKTSYSHFKECPGTTSMILTPDVDKGRLFARGSVSRWMHPPGGKIRSDDTLWALVANDPSRILYGHIWTQQMQVTAEPDTVRWVLTVYQTIVFFDPLIPERSTD